MFNTIYGYIQGSLTWNDASEDAPRLSSDAPSDSRENHEPTEHESTDGVADCHDASKEAAGLSSDAPSDSREIHELTEHESTDGASDSHDASEEAPGLSSATPSSPQHVHDSPGSIPSDAFPDPNTHMVSNALNLNYLYGATNLLETQLKTENLRGNGPLMPNCYTGRRG